MLVLAAFFVVADHQAVAYAAGGDRIYYFNMDDNGLEGNMILVESNGCWGLMDAGHRKATTIQDKNGATYATNVNGLSSQVYCRNGRDVANYMINRLGVTHLDFIVGTHAHSDHIGGIPEVAAATYKDASGRTCYLVDGSTTYYYKEYQHISDMEDDLVRYSSNSWHNQAFAYQAEQAMKNRGANLVDVSKAQVVQGDPGNAYGDYITFNVGNMSFRLYNVHEQTNTGSENVNSIVTVMTNGNYTVVNLADINTGNGAIDKTSQAIAKDYANVDVVVAGHHGAPGSNTKAMFDSLRPHFVVVSNGMENSWFYTDSDLAAALPYAEGRFGTAFYNLSISPYAVVTDLSGNQVYIYSVTGSGNLENAINKMMKSANKTGWVSWVQTNGTLWSYLEKGKSVKNAWRQVDGKWYHFDNTGIMQTGWITDGGNRFYLSGDGSMLSGWQLLNGSWHYFDTNRNSRTFGKLLTGWQQITNTWYYFESDGRMAVNKWVGNCYLRGDGTMATGWTKIGNDWYYMQSNGSKLTGWQTITNTRYNFGSDGRMLTNQWVGNCYLRGDGTMATGWTKIGSNWYYMDGNGKKLTGWQEITKTWYYFESDGHMVTNKWVGNCYLRGDGTMATGWTQIGSNWYYMDGNGSKRTGWQTITNTGYYFYPDGHMATNQWIDGRYLRGDGTLATGWTQIGSNLYYINGDGTKRTGWQEITKTWYYFYPDGHMAVSTWIDNCYLTGDGTMATGWTQIGRDWYYMNKSGAKLTGWQTITNTGYYFYPDGHMAVNTWIDNRYLRGDGTLATGWTQFGNDWYYINNDGSKRTGWQEITKTWYYFYDDGRMAVGTWIDGYYLTGDGTMATGWTQIGSDWYYMDNSGAKLTGWQQITNTWYYFYDNGRMAVDTWIEGYYLTGDGSMKAA